MAMRHLTVEENGLSLKKLGNRIVLALCFVLMAVPVTEARRRSKRAGSVKDGVYKDSKYNIRMTLPEGWSAKVGGNKDAERLILLQENYGIPAQYRDAEDYTVIPRIVVVIGESKMAPHAFVDSILSNSYNGDLKKEVKKGFDFLYEKEIIPKGRKRLQIGGVRGDMWFGQSKYFKNISTGSAGGRRVEGKYGGGLFVLKMGDNLLVAHLWSEWDFFDSIHAQLAAMISSLERDGAEGEDSKEAGDSEDTDQAPDDDEANPDEG